MHAGVGRGGCGWELVVFFRGVVIAVVAVAQAVVVIALPL